MIDRTRERLKNQGVEFTREVARIQAARLKTVKKSAPKKQPALPKTVLNQVRDSMRDADRGLGSLYFVGRVTLPVVFSDPSKTDVRVIAERNEFRLLGSGHALEFSSSKLDRVKEKVVALIEDLKKNKLSPERYLVSEVMIDSNNYDTLKLL